jgi:acyl-CoA dehydrogenase
MDFALSEAQELIQKEVTALAKSFDWEYWREKDRKAEYPTEFVEAFARAGWLGIVIPEAHGGAGLGVTEAVLMLEAICASGAGLSGASPIHFAVFPPMPIIKHGSPALRERILPGIAAGTLSLAFGVTETNAGTDTSRIETMARRDGRDWVQRLVSGCGNSGLPRQRALEETQDRHSGPATNLRRRRQRESGDARLDPRST